jgi:hypothetical protein
MKEFEYECTGCGLGECISANLSEPLSAIIKRAESDHDELLKVMPNHLAKCMIREIKLNLSPIQEI